MNKYKVGDRVLAVSTHAHHKTPAPGTITGFFRAVPVEGVFDYRVRYDSDGLELWSNVVGPIPKKHPVIVITTDGKTTTATKRLGKKVIATATAKCAPDDEFHFETGAALSFARLVGAEVKFAEEEKPKRLSGKFVCVGEAVPLPWWTVGKIYEAVNGCLADDDHEIRGPFTDLAELNHYVPVHFIPLVED